MIHTRCLAVLDSMWGNPGKAPGLFRINPKNRTGSRLYYLLGHRDLWVTNACREQVGSADEHGRPDPEWLAENLRLITFDLLLVCGKVAQQTYAKCGFTHTARELWFPHPAARGSWTKEILENTRGLIQIGVH